MLRDRLEAFVASMATLATSMAIFNGNSPQSQLLFGFERMFKQAICRPRSIMQRHSRDKTVQIKECDGCFGWLLFPISDVFQFLQPPEPVSMLRRLMLPPTSENG
jgi:hypothetical protein